MRLNVHLGPDASLTVTQAVRLIGHGQQTRPPRQWTMAIFLSTAARSTCMRPQIGIGRFRQLDGKRTYPGTISQNSFSDPFSEAGHSKSS